MTVQQASRQLLFQLFHIYEEREARNIADLVMENITEWKRIDRVMNSETKLSNQKENLLASYIVELLAHKPVQYVLNEAWFYGIKFYVDSHVLIPRPETEELVNWVSQDVRERPLATRVLDIGTGSGCIAISLKKKHPLNEIFACDVSEAALQVAEKNAASTNCQISFIQCDFLESASWHQLPQVDIIVSNPPYIPLKDKGGIAPNVLSYEPHLALFVEDNHPLVFYEAIAEFAIRNLASGGSIFVEINDHTAKDVSAIFTQHGFQQVTIRCDLQGRERMVSAREPRRH